MIIRKATTEDSFAVQQIAYTTWHHTYKDMIPLDIQNQFLSEAYSDKAMNYRVKRIIVAEVNETVIGFTDFSIGEDGRKAMLLSLYILPDFQGNGAGTALFEHGISELKDVVRLDVDVEKENEPALEFYKGKGFELEEEITELFYGHKVHTVKLSLDLTQKRSGH
ncbi:GNAT family N-acetyltransferase [Alkalicoccobacillus murimartini]|uniref:Ribosomal protein S18 acetylase RimI-like enzyme n=1 Tax=Alkalicoccobacillus murimartini TaxID=171685 RepID=A0ABT9YIK6_9BACI|nr:GNAT family N-acetyltransferase [Alkalicoccobacillus murimartini]MDQ0207695.1 ribosomal protein S18 acetylase RimI-like enzyme [Alkalicoccobacillus murimartini]